MREAVNLVRLGLTCLEASRQCGVSFSGVAQACARLGVVKKNAGAPRLTQPKPGTRMAQAFRLIEEEASTPSAAARKVGISHQGIYQSLKIYNMRQK